MSAFLLTHATQYAGPGVADVLLGQGHTVLCHDESFTNQTVRHAFERSRSGEQRPPPKKS